MLRCPSCSYTTESLFRLDRHRAKCRFEKTKKRKVSSKSYALVDLHTFTAPKTPTADIPTYQDYCSPDQDPDADHEQPDTSFQSGSPVDIVVGELASFLDALSRKTGARLANQLITFFHGKDFYLSLFRDKIKHIQDCRSLIANNCNTLFRNSGFQQHQISTKLSDGTIRQTILHLRDPLQVLRDQISFLDRSGDFIPTPTSKYSPHQTETLSGMIPILPFLGLSLDIYKYSLTRLQQLWQVPPSLHIRFTLFFSTRLRPAANGSSITVIRLSGSYLFPILRSRKTILQINLNMTQTVLKQSKKLYHYKTTCGKHLQVMVERTTCSCSITLSDIQFKSLKITVYLDSFAILRGRAFGTAFQC